MSRQCEDDAKKTSVGCATCRLWESTDRPDRAGWQPLASDRDTVGEAAMRPPAVLSSPRSVLSDGGVATATPPAPCGGCSGSDRWWRNEV